MIYSIRFALVLVLVLLGGAGGRSQAEGVRASSDQVGDAIKRGDWRSVLSIAQDLQRQDSGSGIAAYVIDIAAGVLGEDRKRVKSLSQYDFPYTQEQVIRKVIAWANVLLEANPDNPHVLMINAPLYHKSNAFRDKAKVVRLFKKARQKAPKNQKAARVFILISLSAMYREMGKLDQAIGFANRAIIADPSASGPYTNLGAALLRKRFKSTAELVFRKGVQKRNPGPMAWSNLGRFYYSMGRLKEALPALEKAVELSPNMIEPRYDLAGIYYKAGEHQKSIEQLRNIIEIAPDSPVGQQELQLHNTGYLRSTHNRQILQLHHLSAPQPLRIEYPGAYYHVMNRGLSHSDIFLEDKGRERFIDLLSEISRL